MADCVLCGGHNNFCADGVDDPVEAFKHSQDDSLWSPMLTKYRCCAIVCEDCCAARPVTSCGNRCDRCRKLMQLWVVVNVLGTEEVVTNE